MKKRKLVAAVDVRWFVAVWMVCMYARMYVGLPSLDFIRWYLDCERPSTNGPNSASEVICNFSGG